MEKGKPYYVTPGTPIVTVISAMQGGNAEKIIRSIHTGSAVKGRQNRQFEDWRIGIGSSAEPTLESSGTVEYDGKKFEVTLKLGTIEGLYLSDGGYGAHASMKPARPGNEYMLQIPKDIEAIVQTADKIVACWVIHGKFWLDRSQKMCNWPYGNDATRPVENNFRIIDGAPFDVSLEELRQKGCVRRTHTGQWNRPNTLAAALAGMQIIAHEFKETSADICVFGHTSISDNANIWGGYATWNDGRTKVKNGFKMLAQCAVSPLTFHVHATKSIFKNYTLQSTELLTKLGRHKLLNLVRAVAKFEPERFYRLIDERGITNKLLEHKNGTLFFENGHSMLVEDAAQNVMQTFFEMREVERNLGYSLDRTKRLVLDTHFYTVAMAFVTGGVVHELSGGDMYRYLTSGEHAEMHCVRNGRLFEALKPNTGVYMCDFHIYPAVPFPDPTQNQYTITQEQKLNNDWKNKKVGA